MTPPCNTCALSLPGSAPRPHRARTAPAPRPHHAPQLPQAQHSAARPGGAPCDPVGPCGTRWDPVRPGGPPAQAADAREGEAEFLAEVSVTGSIEHPNVLPVLGVAVDTPQRCLIYPIMRGGSVADRLTYWRGLLPLNAVQRIEVAAGAARGLAALHEQARASPGPCTLSARKRALRHALWHALAPGP